MGIIAANHIPRMDAEIRWPRSPSTAAAAPTAAKGCKGQVVAIDLTAVEPIPGVEMLHLDFMADEAPGRLVELLRGGKADVVLSDMAAPSSGHASTDHLRIMGLAEAAGAFA